MRRRKRKIKIVRTDGRDWTEPQEIPIARIIKDPELQPRTGLKVKLWNRYKAVWRAFPGEQPFPPVQLADYKGDLYLIDGFHRLKALERVIETSDEPEIGYIKAVITQVESREEMAYLAGDANLKNAEPLRPAEKRKAFHAFIKAGKHIAEGGTVKSVRAIEQDLHGAVHFTTIARWLKKDFPEVHEQMTKNAPLPGEGNKKQKDWQVEELRNYEKVAQGAFQVKAAFNELKGKHTQREALRLLREIWLELFAKHGENAEFFNDNGVLDYIPDY